MNFYSSPTPIPFENHDAQTLLTSQRAPGDVVKSPAPRRIGFHVDVNLLTCEAAGARSPSSDDHINVHDHNLVDVHDHVHDHGTVDSDHDHDRPEEQSENQDHSHREQDEIRRRDRLERQAQRASARRRRLERRAQRLAQFGLQRRRRAVTGPGALDAHHEYLDRGSTSLRLANRFGQPTSRDHDQPELPTAAHLDESRGVADVATYPHNVKRFASGPAHGTALALYFVLLPYVVITKWSLSAHQANASFVRLLLVVLSLFWMTFLFQVVHNIIRLRRGTLLNRDGSAWLAGLVVMVMPFLIPSNASAAVTNAGPSQSTAYVVSPTLAKWSLDLTYSPERPSTVQRERSLPLTASPTGALPLALIAKRRKDSLRQHQFTLSESEIDETVTLLRAYDPQLVATLRQLIGDRLEGVVSMSSDQSDTAPSDDTAAIVVCALEESGGGTVISFAREGGRLLVPDTWTSNDVVNSVVALHDGGRLVFAHDEKELLRALATRSLRSTLVLYLSSPGDLDAELRACAVTVCSVEPRGPVPGERPSCNYLDTFLSPVAKSSELRAELLRSDPRIVGLVEPFTATLRRRCVEMVAYLALHRREPVTGDRLRTRVLTHAEVDASMRTLANTASAVRRSLGSDAQGHRLHAVTSSGLYVTHGLISDVQIFHELVARARQSPINEGAPLLREALDLVQGEPLASALRGFEWFLAEGHAARLARDGEWAALALHHDSIAGGDYELAFWALEKGRLIDPYSDALVTALAQVPRLREFGSDGSGRAQHQTVGAGGAKAVGWTFDRLGDQIA